MEPLIRETENLVIEETTEVLEPKQVTVHQISAAQYSNKTLAFPYLKIPQFNIFLIKRTSVT